MITYMRNKSKFNCIRNSEIKTFVCEKTDKCDQIKSKSETRDSKPECGKRNE